MFIKKSQSGYNRHGEQFARGSFLILFSHNQHKWEDKNNTPHFETHGQSFEVVTGDGFTIQRTCHCAGSSHSYTKAEEIPPYYLKYCPVHGNEYKTAPAELEGKLYACVRHVSLRQLGHFMMGSARIAGQSITVSGAYGADGLTSDYESLTKAAQTKLTEVPKEVAAQFWKGGGWNNAGPEAPIMRKWALETFKSNKQEEI